MRQPVLLCILFSIYSFADDFISNEQWGLNNQGKSQPIRISDLQTLEISAIVGEDIGLNRAPKENLDPNKSIIVAVLDTGIDSTHPALKNHLLPNKGWNFTGELNKETNVLGNADVEDRLGHGTHVTGIITSIAKNIRILPIKIADEEPLSPVRLHEGIGLASLNEDEIKASKRFVDRIGRGILYALHEGAQIINLSLSWPQAVDTEFMRQMIDEAHARSVLIVTAAGNDATDMRVFPCNHTGIICVGSHGPDGALSHFSNYGSSVDVAAPGLNILSTFPISLRSLFYTDQPGYEFKNGTSMAAPFVTGILARLRSLGFSPEESYARLIAGTRPLRIDLHNGLRSNQNKFLRSGSVDLARSIQISPQPLFLPAVKNNIRIVWDSNKSLVMHLKNYWIEAEDVQITAEPIWEKGKSYAHLTKKNWSFQKWNAYSEKDLKTELVIDDPKIPGFFYIRLYIQGKNFKPQEIYIKVEALVQMHRNYKNAEIFTIEGISNDRRFGKPRTVTILDESNFEEFILPEKSDEKNKVKLNLLRKVVSSYRIIESKAVLSFESKLLAIYRLDLDGDKKSEYVFLHLIPEKNAYEFHIFDEKLSPLHVIKYDNKEVEFSPGKFQWLYLSNSNGSARRVPAWVEFGPEPKADQKQKVNWDRNDDEQKREDNQTRIYYLSDQLHAVESPKDYVLLQALAPTHEQRVHGEMPVLLASGKDYEIKHFVGVAKNVGKSILDIKSIDLSFYRVLGLSEALPLTSLDASEELAGTAFFSQSFANATRTTLVAHHQVSSNVLDSLQFPSSVLDAVQQSEAAFLGSTNKIRAAVISQTRYQFQYQDLDSGEVATATMNRYSFIRSQMYGLSFFPVVVKDSRDFYLPGLLSIVRQGSLSGVEILVPTYDDFGKLQSFDRPAKFQFEIDKSCAMTAPMRHQYTHLMFFCGDRFLQIPLVY